MAGLAGLIGSKTPEGYYGNKRKKKTPGAAQQKVEQGLVNVATHPVESAKKAVDFISENHPVKNIVGKHPAVQWGKSALSGLAEDASRTVDFADRAAGRPTRAEKHDMARQDALRQASMIDPPAPGQEPAIEQPAPLAVDQGGTRSGPGRDQAGPAPDPSTPAPDPVGLANAQLPGVDHSSDRRDGQVLMTNVGPGNQGGRALGDVAGSRQRIQANQALKNTVAQQAGIDPSQVNADGTLQAGNMSVQFPAGTDPETVQKLMRQPGRPGTRMRSGLSDSRPEGYHGAMPLASVRGQAQPQGEQYITYENSPHVSAEMAQTINQQIARGRQDRLTAGVNNAADLAQVQQYGLNNLADTGLKNLGDVQKGKAVAEAQALGDVAQERVKGMNKAGEDKRKAELEKLKQQYNLIKPQYVQPEYDDDNNLIPGTGTFVHPYDLSPDYNPANPSPEDRRTIDRIRRDLGDDYLRRLFEIYG